jgi:hypothetical protein
MARLRSRGPPARGSADPGLFFLKKGRLSPKGAIAPKKHSPGEKSFDRRAFRITTHRPKNFQRHDPSAEKWHCSSVHNPQSQLSGL